MKLALERITTSDLQARVVTCQDTVREYAEAMRAGRVFPPVTVFHDGADYYLADGFHRVLAAHQLDLGEITVEVRKGSRADALWYACGANKEHGLKRSNADKRKAVTLALEHRPDASDRAIAEHVGVNNHLVAEVRKLMESAAEKGSTGRTPSCNQLEIKETPQKLPLAGPPPRRNSPPPVNPPPPRRIGIDGRARSVPPPRRVPPPEHNGNGKLPPQKGPLDKVGREIPPGILETWREAEKAKEHLHAVSAMRGLFRRGQDDPDIKRVWAECNFNLLYSEMSNVFTHLSVALPYAVCPTCHGKLPKACRLCGGRGFISEHKWTTAVPKETKDLIAKVVAAEQQ